MDAIDRIVPGNIKSNVSLLPYAVGSHEVRFLLRDCAMLYPGLYGYYLG